MSSLGGGRRVAITICAISLIFATAVYWLLYRDSPLSDAWTATEQMSPIIADIEMFKLEQGVYPDGIDSMLLQRGIDARFGESGLGWGYYKRGDEYDLSVDTKMMGDSGYVHLLYSSDWREWRVGE